MKRNVILLCVVMIISACNQVKVISQEEYNEYVEKIGLT